jgi:hypothetical protein
VEVIGPLMIESSATCQQIDERHRRLASLGSRRKFIEPPRQLIFLGGEQCQFILENGMSL